MSRTYASTTSGVNFMDCGLVFLTANKKGLDASLMADAIHPTGKGWDKLGACMSPVVAQLMNA